jgi:hypothetical protein
MKNDVQTGSGAMIHMPSFIKTGSGIQRSIRGYTLGGRLKSDG